MTFKKKKYIIKNGQELVVRIPSENEAQALIDLKLNYIRDTTTIPLQVDEYQNSEIEERQLIRKYAESKNSILLIATIASVFVGNIDLTGNERQKMLHTGMIGMGIKENYRNLGIGTYLMKETIKWAKKNSPLEIIWLEVYANNDLGLGLYKKMGFKVSGKIENFFKEGNSYYDKIQMYLRVD